MAGERQDGPNETSPAPEPAGETIRAEALQAGTVDELPQLLAAHRRTARRLTQEGAPDKALAGLLQASRSLPMNRTLAGALVDAALRARSEDAAIAVLSNGIEDAEGAERVAIRRQLARLLRRAGDLEAAREQVVMILAERPGDRRARRVLNQLLFLERRWEELDASLEKETREALRTRRLLAAARASVQRGELWAEKLNSPAHAAVRFGQAGQFLEQAGAHPRALSLRLRWLRTLAEAGSPQTQLEDALDVAFDTAALIGERSQVERIARELGLPVPARPQSPPQPPPPSLATEGRRLTGDVPLPLPPLPLPKKAISAEATVSPSAPAPAPPATAPEAVHPSDEIPVVATRAGPPPGAPSLAAEGRRATMTEVPAAALARPEVEEKLRDEDWGASAAPHPSEGEVIAGAPPHAVVEEPITAEAALAPAPETADAVAAAGDPGSEAAPARVEQEAPAEEVAVPAPVLHAEPVIHAPLADAATFARLETQYVARSAWKELAALYRDRIDGIDDPVEKVDLLSRLAELRENELGDLHGAAAVYREWVQLDGDAHALEEQLRLLQKLETISGVRRAIDEAVENAIEPAAKAMALAARAEAQLLRGELEPAIADFEASLALDASRLKVRAGLAEARAASGDEAPLRELLREVSAMPRHERLRADLFRRIARTADRYLSEMEVARTAWSEVLADMSLDPEAQERLAGIARALQDGQSLELALRARIRRDPQSEEARAARVELAQLLERDGRRAAAMDELMQAVRADPGHRDAWLMLIERYLEDGDDGRAAWAMEHAATATEDEQARADLWDRLAVHCREKLRDGGRALVYSTRAANLRRSTEPPPVPAARPLGASGVHASSPVLSKLPRAVAGLRPPSWERSEPGLVPGGADPRPQVSGEKRTPAGADLAALLGNSAPQAEAQPRGREPSEVPGEARRDTAEAPLLSEAPHAMAPDEELATAVTPPPEALTAPDSPPTVEFELPFAAAGSMLSSTPGIPEAPRRVMTPGPLMEAPTLEAPAREAPTAPAAPQDPRFSAAPTLAIPAEEVAALQRMLETQRRPALRPALETAAGGVEARITPAAGVPAASYEEPTAPRASGPKAALDVAGPHDLDLEQLSGALQRYEAKAQAQRHGPRTEEFELPAAAPPPAGRQQSADDRRTELFDAVRSSPLEPDAYHLLAEFFDQHGDVERGDLMAEIATALEAVPEAPPRVPRLILTARDRAGLRHPLLRNEAGELLGLSGLALCQVFPTQGRAAGSKDLFHLETGPGAQAAADAVLSGVRILGLRAPDLYLAEDAGPPLALAFPGALRLLVGRAAIRKALPPAELRFFAGRALFTQAADLLALRSLTLDELQATFAALGEALYAGRRVSREAAVIREHLQPKVVPRLRELYPQVKETLDVDALAEGARHSANRAGLVVAGGVAPALAALRAKRALDEEMAELVRFAASERYLKLRARRIPG